ncbi:P-loop containing nucleoside triphosphate hydrolase protein [Rhodofomes roseus]|uniref:DNA 3'-5' helicase n=1 Tax=Rhodofomes roseus TaxID=34475 RepID=A0ABQ8K852_9APHY|nr:P-loop containing nucleoside triphosphate hydrolase protein [Rhodofomes roseus]KAH9833451.1 P-loop containing nucleoside triphosphate hydrolase protein [Rhodofomes roseus]
MPPSAADPVPKVPTLEEVYAKTLAGLGRRPCRWQAESCRAALKGDKDIISIAPTGSGKTLTFWMPLLFREDGIQLVVTPLNLLGTQNVTELKQHGISACDVRADTATAKLFQEIEDGRYRAIITNPEELFKEGGGFEKLWKVPKFTSRLISIIWDEAHCISTWSSFRADYKKAYRLRYLLPHTRFLLASATFNDQLKVNTLKTMHMSLKDCIVFQRSNDRPNVHIEVRRIEHSLRSFEDLDFLIPPDWKPGDETPSFLVFFDNIEDSIAAAERLRSRLPRDSKSKVMWFNSRMTSLFREEALKAFSNGELYGLCCTDSFGMGINVAKIRLVVQWRLTCDLNTLWQRFGRAVRDLLLDGVAIFLVESKYFDDEKAKASERAEKAKETRKRKAANVLAPSRSAKAARLANATALGDHPATASNSNLLGNRTAGSVHDANLQHDRPATTLNTHNNPSRATPAARIPDAHSDRDVVENPVRPEQPAGSDARQKSPLNDVTIHTHNTTPALQDLAMLRLEFRSEEKPKTQQAAKRTAEDLLTPEMDAFINAGTRPFKCHRKPIMAFYANDKTDHQLCRPDLPAGCTRCVARTSSICCILCSPEHSIFSQYRRHQGSAVAPGTEPVAPPSRASRLPKDAGMLDTRRDLTTALDAFRLKCAEDEYGSLAYTLRPDLILPESVMLRLVECARAQKIGCLDDIKRETKWPAHEVDRYGKGVLEIILR